VQLRHGGKQRAVNEEVNGQATGGAIRVLVISPVRIYLEGLTQLLRAEAGIELTGTAATVPEAVPVLHRSPVDVVLLDLTTDMAECRGVDTIHQLTEATVLPVVVLGIADRPAEVVAYAEAGIAGYVTTDDAFADLVSTVRSASRGEFSCHGRVAAGLVVRLATLSRERRRTPAANLTARELEVVTLIELGLSNKEIARRLSIQLTTVKNHVHNILEKLGVSRRSEAVARLRGYQMPPSTGSRPA
jgi:DNA-binding NarL/FixJ family response regulator